MANLTGATQESILCLVCFDSKHGQVLRGLVPLNSFDLFYGTIAQQAFDYWDKYQEPLGDHFLDIIEAIKKDQPKDTEIYDRIYESLLSIRSGIQPRYVIDQAKLFVRRQQLKQGVLNAVECIERDDLDEADRVLTESMKNTIDLFNPGVLLTDSNKSLAFLTREEDEAVPTGIDQLDSRSLGPGRGELHLFIALPGRGKTWWLTNLGKQAVKHGLSCVHVTLEISEDITCQRYVQALWAVTKRVQDITVMTFDRDKQGSLISIDPKVIQDSRAFKDPDIEKWLYKQVNKLRARLVIKQFPTGALTIRELEGYLDTLEIALNLKPDLLLVDYADLMSVNPDNLRISLGKLYVDLRGLAVKRNIAVATASQANRAAEKKKTIQGSNVGEDFSKIACADKVITYSQTEAEEKLNLARLFVSKCRNEEDHFSVLISQSYASGQFCLSSTRMRSDYWDRLKEAKDDC